MKVSLKIKSIIVVLVVALILAWVSVLISYRVYSTTINEHYKDMTVNLTKTESFMIDKPMVEQITGKMLEIYRKNCLGNGNAPDFEHFSESDWDAYYESYTPVTETTEYNSVLEQLNKMALANDVASIYICYMDMETDKALYIIDGSLNEACLPGTCDDIEDKNLELMKQGIYDFPAYITNYKEYGWLCSASSGICEDNGKLIANAYVDISMDDVKQEQVNFFTRLCLILMAITIFLVVLLLYLINRFVVSPINSLAKATGSFVTEKESHGNESEKSAIARLCVHTGDEIENLADSIQKMEIEINSYIKNLTSVTAEKERIGAELNVATQIQADMLPNIFPAFPEHEEIDIYASMEPAKEVGGDFYDFFMVDDSHIAIVMADVSGKGVPAALFMVITKTLIKNHVQNGEAPKDVFTNVNNQLCENNEVGMFVTGWLGVFDLNTGNMDYVNAGHNYPILLRADGTVEWVKSRPGLVLAGMENIKYRQNSLQLNEGDTIYLYTDGVTEALNPDLELFGDERLEQIMKSDGIKKKTPKEILELVSGEIKAFANGAEQADDITMLALHYINADRKEKMKWSQLRVDADKNEWNKVCSILEEQLETAGCGMKEQTQIIMAAEEIFVNIASYAYEEDGYIDIKTRLKDTGEYQLLFEDSGVPYNPLEKQDPDVSLGANEREVGGLGIYLVKKTMDSVEYKYKDEKNTLMLTKKIN